MRRTDDTNSARTNEQRKAEGRIKGNLLEQPNEYTETLHTPTQWHTEEDVLVSAA